MYDLLNVVLVISAAVFGVTFVARTSEDGVSQQKVDRRVLAVSGLAALVSGLWLWTFGW